ncbi:MAG: hypothetical protein Fur0017_11290 [Anaerolineales bacterium]
MTLPAILFGLVVAFTAGALFHVIRGGGGLRLLLHLLLSALGFALGQVVGMWFGVVLYKFGVLDIGMGGVGSVFLLILGDWLSRIKPTDESSV